jgi:nitronate monooxygenase
MKKLKIGDLVAKYPIIQGGMGVGISRSGLAVAVANMGGVGVISAAGLGLFCLNEIKDYKEACIYGLKQEIKKAKERTKGIIGVNIMVALTNFSDMVKTSVKEQADVIFSGAGLPLDLPSYLSEEDKTKLVPIVSSARATKIICEKWTNKYNYVPDAIVVEGPKAGGHLGYKLNQINDKEFSLEMNLPHILEEVDSWRQKFGKEIPVIAAGGIYTGGDMHKFMDMGADGVQMATRFVTTDECDASIEFKNAYINAKKDDLIIIKSPVGMPGRAIKNSFLESVARGEKCPKQCIHHCIKTCDSDKSPYCIMLALLNAYYGNIDKGFCFAGSNAYKATKIISVQETFNEIINEYNNYEKLSS